MFQSDLYCSFDKDGKSLGCGDFGRPQEFSGLIEGALGDFDSNGALDFLLAHTWGVTLIMGGGSVPVAVDYKPGDGLDVGDVDGDGAPEILIWDGKEVNMFRFNPLSGSELILSFRGPPLPAGRLAVGDVLGNQRAEIVLLDDMRIRIFNETEIEGSFCLPREGLAVAVGNLVRGIECLRVVLVVDAAMFTWYDFAGHVLDQFPAAFGERDHLAVGNLDGIGSDEIVQVHYTPSANGTLPAGTLAVLDAHGGRERSFPGAQMHLPSAMYWGRLRARSFRSLKVGCTFWTRMATC